MKKRSPEQIEHRSFAFQVRAEKPDGKPVLHGHAAVFNTPTILVPADSWYKGSPEIREIIEPGAFSKSIKESDQRAFWNHNTDIVLGRRKNNTLRLFEDESGLGNEIFPPETDLIRDMVLTPIERGDVNGESFGFRVIRDKVVEEDNVVTIFLRELELIEVSPCSLPQYPETDLSLSSRSAAQVEDIRKRLTPPEEQRQESTPVPEHPEISAPLSHHLDEQLFLRLDLAVRRHKLAA